MDLKLRTVDILPIFNYEDANDGQEFAGLQIELELVVAASDDEDALPVASIVAAEAQVKVFVNTEVSSEHGLHGCVERGPCSISAHIPPVLLSRFSCNDVKVLIDSAGSAQDVGNRSGLENLTGYEKLEPIGIVMYFSSEGVQEMDCLSTMSRKSPNAVEKPEDPVLARHPSEVLCVILARQPRREAPGVYSALFAVLGLFTGCKYRATLIIWSQIYGTVLEGAIPNHSAVLCITLAAVPENHSVM